MNYKNAKLAAYVLAGVIAFSGSSIRAEATGVSSLLPAAGLALTLEEGSDQKELKASAKSTAQSNEKEKKEELVTSLKDKDKDKNKDNKDKAAAKDDAAKEDSAKENASKDDTEKSSDTKKADVEIKNTLETKADQAAKKENDKPLLIEDGIKNEKAAAKAEDDKDSAAKQDENEKTAEAKEDVKEDAEDEKTAEEKEFSKLVIAKVNDYVNIRSIPSEEGEILGKLYDKSVGDFVQERNGWYRITSGSVTGFVKAEYCVTGDDAVALAKKVGTRVATVTTTTLKVRESAGMDAPVLGLVPIEEELTVVEELDGWVKVDIEEGYGYVSSDYVSLRTDFVKAESKAEEEARLKKEEDAKKAAKAAAKKAEEKLAKQKAEQAAAAAQSSNAGSEEQASAPVISGGSSLGQAVVDYAMQFVGNPYVYGGTSLTNGTDCSGFVMSVYKNFGVSLPHSSHADRSQGYAVGGLDSAQPGDIVCYSGHVGIYAGGGKIVHASTSKTGIIVSNANYRTPLAVRRIF